MTAGTIPAPAAGFPPSSCSSATLSKENWPFLFQVSAGRVAVLGAQEGPEAAATLVQRGSRSLTPPDFRLNLSCARCSSYLGSLFFSWKSKGRRRTRKKTNRAKAIGLHFLSGPNFPFLFLKKEGLQAIHTLDVARLQPHSWKAKPHQCLSLPSPAAGAEPTPCGTSAESPTSVPIWDFFGMEEEQCWAPLNMRPLSAGLSTPFVHGQEPGPTPPPAASLSASATTCEQLPIPKLLSFPFALLK